MTGTATLFSGRIPWRDAMAIVLTRYHLMCFLGWRTRTRARREHLRLWRLVNFFGDRPSLVALLRKGQVSGGLYDMSMQLIKKSSMVPTILLYTSLPSFTVCRTYLWTWSNNGVMARSKWLRRSRQRVERPTISFFLRSPFRRETFDRPSLMSVFEQLLIKLVSSWVNRSRSVRSLSR